MCCESPLRLCVQIEPRQLTQLLEVQSESAEPADKPLTVGSLPEKPLSRFEQ